MDRVECEVVVNSDRKMGRTEVVIVKDLLTLAPGAWVNDVIVNFYLRELLLKGWGSAKRAYIFRSQFWQGLSNEDSHDDAQKGNYNYSAVKTYTRDRAQKVKDPLTGKSVPLVSDIFDATKYDLILFPICHKAHWSLVV